MKKSNLFKTMTVMFLCIVGTINGTAQDLKSIISSVASAVTSKVTGESASIVGTWTYSGPACEFESDNLLAKAGGSLASSKIEEKMSGVFEKLGFTEDSSYTFSSDSTYSATIGSRTISGTYSYDSDAQELTLKTTLGVKVTVNVSKGLIGSTMSLLFEADKLMSLAQTITGAISNTTSNSAISTATSLLDQYDGLQLGISLTRQ